MNSRVSVLVADDETAVRDMIVHILTHLEFRVTAVSNGKEAFEAFIGHDLGFDIILLDMLMPEMSGADAYKKIREQSLYQPIIIYSGYSVSALTEVLAEDRYATAIQKPVNSQILKDMIQKFIQLRGASI